MKQRHIPFFTDVRSPKSISAVCVNTGTTGDQKRSNPDLIVRVTPFSYIILKKDYVQIMVCQEKLQLGDSAGQAATSCRTKSPQTYVTAP